MIIEKIGITGATGSLGKQLIKSNKKHKFIRYNDDIRSKKKLSIWFKKNNFDIILHLAAVVPIKTVNQNKKKAFDINYIGTKNIVDEAYNNKIKWFFFSSTSHVYSSSLKKINENHEVNPISYYGKTKLLAENYIKKKFSKSNTRYCIARIFSTTNKNQKKNFLVPDLKNKIKKVKKNITLKNLNHYRDFISLNDLSKIIFKLLDQKFNGLINLGSGNPVYLKEIAKIISKRYNKNIRFKDSDKTTFLIADTKKLKKICKIKTLSSITSNIF
jgi:nucleoside-diphosphate-sugar epimerase